MSSTSHAQIPGFASYTFPTLRRGNYEAWKNATQLLLIEKGLWNFVTETEPLPTSTWSVKDTREYNDRKNKSLATIGMCVTDDYKKMIIECASSKIAWDTLKAIFEPVTRIRKARLRRDFLDLRLHEGEEMAVFLSRVDQAASELVNFKVVMSDDDIAYQYLDRLPPEYEILVNQIYHWSDNDFTKSKIRDELLSDFNLRKQKQLDSEYDSNTNKALVTFQSTNMSSSTSKNGRGRNRSNSRARAGQKGNQRASPTSTTSVPTCYNCGGTGHVVRTCSTPLSAQQQQYQSKQRGAPSSRRGGRRGAFYVEATIPDEAQDGVSFMNRVSLPDFYFDSAASVHICNDKTLLYDYKQFSRKGNLTLGEGSSTIDGKGCLDLLVEEDGSLNTVHLANVFYAPKFVKNLISIGAIDQNHFHIDIFGGKLSVYHEKPSECLIRGQSENCMYRVLNLRDAGNSNSFPVNQSELSTLQPTLTYANVVTRSGKNYSPKTIATPVSDPTPKVLPVTTDTKFVRPVVFSQQLADWHQRYAHLHIKGLHTLAKSGKAAGLELVDSKSNSALLCRPCALAKSTKHSFVGTDQLMTTRPLELVHMDVWGPCRVTSYGKSRYFLSIIDDYSRYAFVYLLKKKSDVLQCFRGFQRRMLSAWNEGVTTIRTDNGMEFCSTEFDNYLLTQGIVHQHTNSYSPQMNGIAERYNRTLIEGVRALLVDSGLPPQLWAELVQTVNHLRNRFPHSKLNHEIPYCRWFGKNFSVRYMRKIGSKAYVHHMTDQGKINPKAWEGVIVGYALSTRGYRVWDPKGSHVEESKHVQVDEGVMYGNKNFDDVPDLLDVTHPITPVEHFDENQELTTIYFPIDDTVKRSTLPFMPVTSTVASTSTTQSSTASASGSAPVGTGAFVSSLSQASGGGTHRTSPVKSTQLKTVDSHVAALDPMTMRTRSGSLSHKQSNNRALRYEDFSKWERIEKTRKTGVTAGKVDVYYISPPMDPDYSDVYMTHRSALDVKRFCVDEGIIFDIKAFNFKPLAEQEVDAAPDTMEAHLTILEPSDYFEAMDSFESDDWKKSMDDEISTLKSRDVYKEVDKPPKTKILGNKWIYRLKRDAEGNVKRFRSRLVVQGFRQTHGVDFDEVFSPVVDYVLVRVFFVLLVVLRGWVDTHIDIKCAYLYGKLKESIHMQIPLGYRTNNNVDKVWLLQRALYGLHQSGRQWYFDLDDTLQKLGFVKFELFNCVYTLGVNVVLVVYVDDIVIFSSDTATKEIVLNLIGEYYEFVNLGKVTMLLGVKFIRENGRIVMSQKHYIEKLAEEYDVIRDNMIKVPVHVGSLVESPRIGEELDLNFPYRSLVGSLLFLASRTRPDILFPVILLSQYNEQHTATHVGMLMQVLRYVVNTIDYAIDLSKCSDDMFSCFTDASYASDRDSRKSFGGFIVFLGGVPISWGCKKQSMVTLSTMHAEYVAMTKAVIELHWLARIYDHYIFHSDGYRLPITYCDSQAAIDYCKNELESNAHKQMDIKYKFLRGWLRKKYFELRNISTTYNVADIFTKPLSRSRIDFLCENIFVKLE